MFVCICVCVSFTCMHECVELSVFIYLLLQVCLHGMEVLMFEIQAQGSINNLDIGIIQAITLSFSLIISVKF